MRQSLAKHTGDSKTVWLYKMRETEPSQLSLEVQPAPYALQAWLSLTALSASCFMF